MPPGSIFRERVEDQAEVLAAAAAGIVVCGLVLVD